MSVIGGADGPTAIFLTDELGWINWFGLAIVVLMLIPNIVYAVKERDAKNLCESRALNILEQLGRYGCMLLMVFNIPFAQTGFPFMGAFIAYLLGNALFMLLYWIFWAIWFKRRGLFVSMALAVLPTLMFLLSGLTLGHWLLVGFAVLFGVCHIWVSYVNASKADAEGGA